MLLVTCYLLLFGGFMDISVIATIGFTTIAALGIVFILLTSARKRK